MAKYLLTGIDDEKWKRFKAGCGLEGVTIKEVLLSFIDTRNMVFTSQHITIKHHANKPEKGGKRK